MAVRGGSQAAANYEEPEWDEAVAKAPSPTQERFVEWITEKAQEEIEANFKGLDLDNAKQAAAFRAGAIMCFRFRMPFQASPENQKAQEAARAAVAKTTKDEDDEDEKPAKKAKGKKSKGEPEPEPEPAPKAKKGKAAKAKPAPEPEEEDEDDEPKPKAKSKATKGKRSSKNNSAF